MSILKNLDVSTKSWDPILCFIIKWKLDQQSLAALENSADAPTEISAHIYFSSKHKLQYNTKTSKFTYSTYK